MEDIPHGDDGSPVVKWPRRDCCALLAGLVNCRASAPQFDVCERQVESYVIDKLGLTIERIKYWWSMPSGLNGHAEPSEAYVYVETVLDFITLKFRRTSTNANCRITVRHRTTCTIAAPPKTARPITPSQRRASEDGLIPNSSTSGDQVVFNTDVNTE